MRRGLWAWQDPSGNTNPAFSSSCDFRFFDCFPSCVPASPGTPLVGAVVNTGLVVMPFSVLIEFQFRLSLFGADCTAIPLAGAADANGVMSPDARLAAAAIPGLGVPWPVVVVLATGIVVGENMVIGNEIPAI